MFGERRQTMCHDDRVANRVAQRLGYIRANDRIKQIIKHDTLFKGQGSTIAVFVPVEIGRSRAHDAKLLVAVAQ